MASFKGYDDFVCDYNAARATIIAEHGENWHLVAGASLWACLPRTWARCKVYGRVSSAPRDRRLPVARYWPSGELPVGPVYAELDTYREIVADWQRTIPRIGDVEEVHPWHHRQPLFEIEEVGEVEPEVEDHGWPAYFDEALEVTIEAFEYRPMVEEVDPFAEALKRPPVNMPVEVADEAPKRRRGRPRKVAMAPVEDKPTESPVETPVETPVEAPVEAPVKTVAPRRGRPRKAEVYTVKRPPGRPRKVAVAPVEDKPIVYLEEVQRVEIAPPLVIPPPSFLQSARAVLRGMFGRL